MDCLIIAIMCTCHILSQIKMNRGNIKDKIGGKISAIAGIYSCSRTEC